MPSAVYSARRSNRYKQLHFFYDQLCESCAEFNYRKRLQDADLRGRIAFVTGGRVKIGYQVWFLGGPRAGAGLAYPPLNAVCWRSDA